MRLSLKSIFAAVLLAAAGAAAANAPGDSEVIARTRLYAELADHNLLQIMLVVPGARGKSNLGRSREGSWQLAGEVFCVDVSALREEIETRTVRELPEEARRQPLAADDFYRAVRFEPPRLNARDDRDYSADLTAALTRMATAKFVKKATVELNQGGAGCVPDAIAVPAIRFFKPAYPQAAQSTWLARLERGELVPLGMLSVAEIRAARTQRLATASSERSANARAPEQTKRTSVAGEDQIYGALRIESGRFMACYTASDDPVLPLVAWALADSDKAKRWMSAAAESPKAIADLDALLTELRKPAGQRQCTLLVATTPVLAKVKAQLERERLSPMLYPETVSAAQVIAAYGFRSIEELKFAREIGVDSGELFASLRALGLDTRAGYELALRRYSWQFGATRPDAETLALFVRDEREAATKGTTVKALRAERGKRDHFKLRNVSTIPG